MVSRICLACNLPVPDGQFHCGSCGSANIGLQPQTTQSADSVEALSYADRGFSAGYPNMVGPGQQATRAQRLGGYLLDVALSWVTFGIGWLVWMLIVAPSGLTPAKQLIGLKIVVPGTSIASSWWKVALRHYAPLFLGFVISPFTVFGLLSLPFAFVFLLTVLQILATAIPVIDALFIFGPRKQRLVDMAFRTSVIATK